MASLSNTTRANAIRIELNSRPGIDIEMPIQWPTITLKRSTNEFAVHEFMFHEKEGEIEKLHSTTYRDPAMAWSGMLAGKNDDHYGVVVFIGPGETPIILEAPVMFPNSFQVWFIDRDNQPHVVGQYLHRLSAMAVAKAITKAGNCPIAISPYMCLDSEWDSEHILQSTEVSEVVRKAFG